MIWGVGTGRCGTKSLSVQLGGVHEPSDCLGAAVMKLWRGEDARDEIRARLERRMLDYEPMPVVDPRQSYVIPLIREVDPEARFIWMYRHPVPSIRSWLARGSWSAQDRLGGRYHPWGGYPSGWSRVRRGCWFYRSVNGLIRQDLLERFEVWSCPEDLTVCENENTDVTWAGPHAVELTDRDVRLIVEECTPMYAEMGLLRERTKGRVL